MPTCDTRYFGQTEYSTDSVITFVEGPLGFEDETAFLVINRPDQYPLVYLQSTSTAELCFLALPVLAVAPDYRIVLHTDEAGAIGTDETPEVGTEILCLALLTVHEQGPTANLLAPVVVNLQSRAALQCINLQGGYSHQHALARAEEGVAA